jgi:membrane associated rhomboid family serine protease
MGPLTRSLIIINVVVFGLEVVFGDAFVASFALWPVGHFFSPEIGSAVSFHVWQLVTSAFLHADPTHLLLNMFALWMFGRDVERALGTRHYFGTYAAAVLSSSLVQLLVVSVGAATSGVPYPTLGASGGVFGVLLAYAMLFPRRTVMLVFPPIPMPAWLFVSLYAVLELANGVFGTQAGVAHFAHLGGMLGAYLVLHFGVRRAGYR